MHKASTDSRDEELRLLREGAARAYRKRHHDTCSHSLVSVCKCDCGFVEFAAALRMPEGDAVSVPTPRPWRLWKSREGEGNLAIEHLPPCWVGIESMHGVGALGQAVAAGFGPDNAALILRAVNAHDVLVEALQLMTPAPGFPKCDRRCASMASAFDEDPRCDCGFEEIRDNAEKARAALAQVKP